MSNNSKNYIKPYQNHYSIVCDKQKKKHAFKKTTTMTIGTLKYSFGYDEARSSSLTSGQFNIYISIFCIDSYHLLNNVSA